MVSSPYDEQGEYRGTYYPYSQEMDTFKSGPKGNFCLSYNTTSLVRGVTCYANPQCCHNYCDGTPEPDWWQTWNGKKCKGDGSCKGKAPITAPRTWPPEHVCPDGYDMEGYYWECEDPV